MICSRDAPPARGAAGSPRATSRRSSRRSGSSPPAPTARTCSRSLGAGGRRGALGARLIQTTERATYAWEVVRGLWAVEQVKLDRPAAESLVFAGWVTAAAVQAVLARAGLNLDSLTRAAARRDFRP